jgi:hypothetical protein
MAKYNTNNGCSVCGEPAKQKCSRCGAVRYCDAGISTVIFRFPENSRHLVCQKEDWKSHRPLCNSWQGAKWQGLTFVPANRPGANLYAFRFNKYDNVQHGDAQKRLDRMKEDETPGPPSNTHGTTPFIVKLQVNSSMAGGPAHTMFPVSDARQDETDFFIYDQRRTIEVIVLRDSSADVASFNTVREVVHAKGERGLKAFFWAIRTGEWTLDVCLDKFPEWQKW